MAMILRILHPHNREIIQTFCLPVSLIRVTRMAQLVIRLIAIDCPTLLDCALMCRVGGAEHCCRETVS